MMAMNTVLWFTCNLLLVDKLCDSWISFWSGRVTVSVPEGHFEEGGTAYCQPEQSWTVSPPKTRPLFVQKSLCTIVNSWKTNWNDTVSRFVCQTLELGLWLSNLRRFSRKSRLAAGTKRSADMDRVSTENPIRIQHTSGHLGVANSLALKRVKVTYIVQ